MVLSPTTGSDGKSYKMACLPPQYINGWLFTINSKNINEESRYRFNKFKNECLKALNEYFFINPIIERYKANKNAEMHNKLEGKREVFSSVSKDIKQIKNEIYNFNILTKEELILEISQTKIQFPE